MRKIYSYEECKERALCYKTRKELKEKEPGIYNKINSKKWGKELFSHMNRLDHREIQYTKEMCEKIVSDYEFLKDFREEKPRIYALIHYHGWQDIFKNLKPTGSLNKRNIYAYEFPEHNAVYIGLTYNMKVRNKEHHLKGTLFQWAKRHNIQIYEPKIIEENVSSENAGEREEYFMKKYQNNGWFLINKAKAGSLGGTVLKKDNIVLFSEKGCYIDNGSIEEIGKKYGIKRNLIRICLRKQFKTTSGYQILYKEEWEKMGSPIIIEDKTDVSKEKKIAILDLNFNIEHVSSGKMDARRYLGLTSSVNCLTFVRENLICNYGMIPQKWVCYYDDYLKYKNGDYILFDPKVPKNKKKCFIPLNATEVERNTIIEVCFKRSDWKKRALERKKLKRKCDLKEKN